MNAVFQNACYYQGGTFRRGTVSVSEGILRPDGKIQADARLIDCERYTLIPGLTDVHVHFREPGFSYKETIASGTLAAAHGGYTAVCTMPNLDPTPDDLRSLNIQLDIIRRDARIAVYPYGTITRGEKGAFISDMDAMAPYVCAFSDDGHGVQDDDIMRAAMCKARSLGKIITAHCEDNALLHGGYIHDGIYCKAHGHRGICSESEWGQIKRDLDLIRETGCSYHICHISTKESVELIRRAKREGLDVTCETAPHYLLLDDSMLKEEGRFKMNPPVRSKEDREALTEGILDGTIDMIATDHAPHSAEEKSRGLAGSLMGIVGIETAFPLMYTYFVKKGIFTLEKLIDLMYTVPCKRFGIANPFEEGKPANFSVWDLDAGYIIDPDDFLSKGKATPFAGWKVNGKNRMTVCGGDIAWIDPVMEKGETK